MTGYLQRLAAGAATIDRPIHPVVPPIFAAAAGDRSDQPSLEEISVSRAADAAPPRAPPIGPPAGPQRAPIVADVEPPVAAAPDAATPDPQASPPRLAPAHVVAAATTDVAPRRADQPRRDDPDRLRPGDEKPDSGKANAIGVQHARPTPDLAAPRANADRHDAARRDVTLVRAERTVVPLLAPAAPTDRETPAFAALAPPRPASTSASQRRAPDARHAANEPHEVQIHIGRIEVTAVPPAPARVAAPRRTGMSLDDYLKRRNGRAP
jgi:hypothetical protein